MKEESAMKGHIMKKLLLLAVLLAAIVIMPPTHAGVLGKPYIGLELGSTKPGDDEISAFDDSIISYGLGGRFPLDAHLDLIASASQSKMSGDMYFIDPMSWVGYYAHADATSTKKDGEAS